jgi:hypothetical protein
MINSGRSLRGQNASPNGGRAAAINVVVWLVPFVVFASVYHAGLNAWWMNDDSAILLSVIENGVLPHFYRPMPELGQPPSNLTPWLFASYGIDYTIGALNPRIAYVHHFLAWAAALATLTVALRLFLHPAIAALVLIWFILAVPTSTVIELLCTRHYLEGLLFATLCILAYAAYRRNGRLRYVAVSALLYAMAMMAKEVFVPLGPLLVLHFALFADVPPERPRETGTAGALRRTWAACAALWPHIALAAMYVAYRGYMLGFDHLLSAYGVREWQTQPSMLLEFPATWESTFRWPRWQATSWLALIASGLALWYARSTRWQCWRGIVLGLAITTALLAPIYPVWGILSVHRWNWHYLFLPGLAFFVLAGWASQVCVEVCRTKSVARAMADASAISRHAGTAVVVVLVFLTAAQFRSARLSAWPWHKDEHVDRYRVEGGYELYSADRTLIVDAIGTSAHHAGLQGIRRILLHVPAGPQACAPGECTTAVVRQRELGMECVQYFSGPPRLETVECSIATAK